MANILFAVADVHGCFSALKKALDEAGFDENNSEHVFVSCGDLFDRGEENLKVYNFVKGLKRKILIKGNHEDNLYTILESGVITQDDIDNGTGITAGELLGKGIIDKKGVYDFRTCSENMSEIKCFLDSMVDYYETGKQVFVHGWLPVVFKDNRPIVDPEWHEASSEYWKEARLMEWQQLYGAGAMLEGKTIVCGHRPSYLAHVYDSLRSNDCSDIFYGDGMIAIDTATVRTGKINVLVVQEG